MYTNYSIMISTKNYKDVYDYYCLLIITIHLLWLYIVIVNSQLVNKCQIPGQLSSNSADVRNRRFLIVFYNIAAC